MLLPIATGLPAAVFKFRPEINKFELRLSLKEDIDRGRTGGRRVASSQLMKNAMLTTLGLAVTFVIGLSANAHIHAASPLTRDDGQATHYGGSLDARQHGYEHAYRDGADRGRQDRERRAAYSLKDNDYQIGARTYERAFGDRNQYMDGYRDGYKAGYDDGFAGRDGQYNQLYARPQAGVGVRVSPRDDPYADRPYSSTDMAFDAGYREGITIGQQDRGRNARSNYRSSSAYKNADLGYRSTYGDKRQYQTQYRDGIERGYEDGFGRVQARSANENGRSPEGGNSDNGSRPAASNRGRNLQATQGGTFTVAANRQWTPTGIRVNQGEVLRFNSSGEIRFTGSADDRAGVAGSPAHKFVSGAPLPTALAGALIGRIDSGLPFGIGDQTSITVPASGLLYLGTNDDNVSDNSGQFQVVISSAR
jgi:hypothetical protein